MSDVDNVIRRVGKLIEDSENTVGKTFGNLTDSVNALIEGYGGVASSYDDAIEGQKLYDVAFSSPNYLAVDDTESRFDDGGDFSYTVAGKYHNHWRLNTSENAKILDAENTIMTKSDTNGKADQRFIGYFPKYDLENKTYTLEFEYFRNFEKRHKVFFACGNFTDASTGGAVTNGGYDTSMPCLAIELNKASNGTVDYRLYRQSAGFVNDTNLFNRQSVPFSDIYKEKQYSHDLRMYSSVYKAEGGIDYNDWAYITITNTDPTDLTNADFDTIYGLIKDSYIKCGDLEGYVRDIPLEGDYWIYVETEGGRKVKVSLGYPQDTVTTISEGEVRAQMKIVLKGGAKKKVKLYEGTGAIISNATRKWEGEIIPITYTIYHTVNDNDIKIAEGCIYQPAKIGIVFGIGNYEVLADNEYYGCGNLSIYKGDITKVHTLTEINSVPDMLSILNNASKSTVGNFYLYVGDSSSTYENGAIYRLIEKERIRFYIEYIDEDSGLGVLSKEYTVDKGLDWYELCAENEDFSVGSGTVLWRNGETVKKPSGVEVTLDEDIINNERYFAY